MRVLCPHATAMTPQRKALPIGCPWRYPGAWVLQALTQARGNSLLKNLRILMSFWNSAAAHRAVSAPLHRMPEGRAAGQTAGKARTVLPRKPVLQHWSPAAAVHTLLLHPTGATSSRALAAALHNLLQQNSLQATGGRVSNWFPCTHAFAWGDRRQVRAHRIPRHRLC